jgi:hypothetical protein
MLGEEWGLVGADEIQAVSEVWGTRLARDLQRIGRPPDWLQVVGDSARVRAALGRSIQDFASGELELSACKFKRARIKDGSWTATYRVTVGSPHRGVERVMDLRGQLRLAGWDPSSEAPSDGGFGTEGWRCYLSDLRMEFALQPPDSALPSLPLLTDPISARALLERGIRDCSPAYAGLRIMSCTPEVKRYKPGLRCTLMYELEFPPECQDRGWPDRVVAKTFEAGQGRNAYEGMVAMWNSGLRSSTEVTIAEPLAFLDELSILVQGTVPGELTLKKVLRSSLSSGLPKSIRTLSGHVRKAGRALAEFHACGATCGDVVAWESELAAIKGGVDRLTEPVPELAGVLTPLLARLEIAAAELPPEPLVPSHRSFRPAQVLMHQDDIAFIDFDGFCQSEPGLDLATFRFTLMDLGLRALTQEGKRPLDEQELHDCLLGLDDLCEKFLSAYEEISPVSRTRLALWEAVLIVREILDCWRKIKFEHLERRLHFLHRHLAMSGAPLAMPRTRAFPESA